MENKELKTAIFAAGCFWGVEAAFRKLQGVTEVESGYTGGKVENPTYEQVCSGTTGHAEAVRVTYDPKKIDYIELLKTFWKIHDPTQMNRQGGNVGHQYRSAIFYQDEEQKRAAEKSKKELAESDKYSSPIVTEIVKAEPFYRAEEYHQRYLEKNGRAVC